MARRKKEEVKSDPFDIIISSLEDAAKTNSIFSYKPHAKQQAFHSAPAKVRTLIGGNRCLAVGTEVLMSDGSVKTVENINVGDYVISGTTGRPTRVIKTWANGKKAVNTYAVGRYQDVEYVTCTSDHKFFAGYEKRGVLGQFAKYPIGRLVNSRGRHKIQRSLGTNLGGRQENDAYLLGLMLGDGHFADSPSHVTFSCADEELAKEFSDVFTHRRDYIYQINKKDRQHYFDWFLSLGLIGTRSGDKFIPKEVWSWDEDSIAELCGGLLVTDGSFYRNKNGEYHVAFSSNSYELISEFRRLMGIRLGIWGSTITYESRGTYSITYGTYEALSAINSKIPIYGVKANKMQFMYSRKSYSSHVGVKSFEDAGVQETYDITVECESHTFMLANGLVTSNSGKTHAGAAEGVFWLRAKHPYRKIPNKKIQGRVIGVDFINGVGKILLPKYAEFIPPSDLINGSWEDSWSASEKMLTLDNGNTVEFMSYDQDLDKFAGTSRDFIHLDEEPPQTIFNENRARVVDVNGDIWLTMTPLDGFTWTYKNLYLRGLDPDEPNYFTIEVSMEDNAALSAEARALFLDSLDEEERKAREHGQYMSVGGKVYKTFTTQSHVIKYDYDWINRKRADGWALYESVDHGWNNPTAWIWAIVSPAGSPLEIVVIDEHVQSEMTIPEHAAIVREKRKLYGQPAITTGDPAMMQTSALNGLSAISTYAENGIYIGVEGVPKGPGSVKIGVEKLNRYFQKNKNGIPHMRIMDECPILIDQLGLLRWKSYKGKAKDENNKYEEIQKKDDHAPDALRYMATLMPDLQREGPEVEKVDSTGFSPKPLTPEQMNIDPLLAKMRMGDTGEYFTVGEDSDSEWTVVDAY